MKETLRTGFQSQLACSHQFSVKTFVVGLAGVYTFAQRYIINKNVVKRPILLKDPYLK